VQEELAECLQALGRTKAAAAHFARAYELLSNDPGFPSDETRAAAAIKGTWEIEMKRFVLICWIFWILSGACAAGGRAQWEILHH